MRTRTRLDLERLKYELQHMTIRHGLYKVLKEELSRLGHWKCRPRGNPKAGGEAAKRKRGQRE